MEQFSLQHRGNVKCALPPDSLYTGPALEMASSAATARLHASLLATALPPEGGRILEIAAGIGADSILLTRVADALVCIEADPLHARMLRHNLDAAQARNAMVLRGSAETLLQSLKLHCFDAVFADPARREAPGRGRTRRSVEIENYSPPFSFFQSLPLSLPILIKIAPAAEVPGGWGVATVAADGECKEQLLHRGMALPPLCAIDADSGERWTPGESREAIVVRNPAWLIEPHAAIIRTGAVAQYCREHHCEPIDPMIAYGWSESEPQVSPWHRRFRILRVEKYHRKNLQRGVDEFGFGARTEIKKRGFPETPDEVRKKLRFRGERKGLIFLTRQGDGHLMIFAERPSPPGG
ncbi:MAG: RsmD family RNA methyltransferase [Bacteroidetes bacterium]|nr:RsmD family RNA methyltransferase [Bacteroidota bacterium]